MSASSFFTNIANPSEAELLEPQWELIRLNMHYRFADSTKFQLLMLDDDAIQSHGIRDYRSLTTYFTSVSGNDGELVIVKGRKIYHTEVLTKNGGMGLVFDRIQGKWKDGMIALNTNQLGYFKLKSQ